MAQGARTSGVRRRCGFLNVSDERYRLSLLLSPIWYNPTFDGLACFYRVLGSIQCVLGRGDIRRNVSFILVP